MRHRLKPGGATIRSFIQKPRGAAHAPPVKERSCEKEWLARAGPLSGAGGDADVSLQGIGRVTAHCFEAGASGTAGRVVMWAAARTPSSIEKRATSSLLSAWDERILKRLDDDGDVIGFLIHEMSTLKQPSPLEFELASEAPADDIANITVRQAALRPGISERRVRRLARDGRVRGAVKAGAEWLIPTPVEVVPGRRGPVGGRRA